MKNVLIKFIRIIIAIPLTIGAFIFGWLIYFFCLGIGPGTLAYLIFWCLPKKILRGVFEYSEPEVQKDAIMIQIMPFMIARMTFIDCMNGFKKI